LSSSSIRLMLMFLLASFLLSFLVEWNDVIVVVSLYLLADDDGPYLRTFVRITGADFLPAAEEYDNDDDDAAAAFTNFVVLPKFEYLWINIQRNWFNRKWNSTYSCIVSRRSVLSLLFLLKMVLPAIAVPASSSSSSFPVLLPVLLLLLRDRRPIVVIIALLLLLLLQLPTEHVVEAVPGRAFDNDDDDNDDDDVAVSIRSQIVSSNCKSSNDMELVVVETISCSNRTNDDPNNADVVVVAVKVGSTDDDDDDVGASRNVNCCNFGITICR
jgi:hypothetical protein